jgi:hypothetical protein
MARLIFGQNVSSSSNNFALPDFNEQTGHFTQVIWRSSKQLGCGMALCRGNHFWVCRYSPAGNVGGQLGRARHVMRS